MCVILGTKQYIVSLYNLDLQIASKNIIADLNKGEKLNNENYNIWSFKIRYVLEEQEFLEVVNHVLAYPDEDTLTQHRRATEAYQAWKKANATTQGILVSSMNDDLTFEYKDYGTAYGCGQP